jgi:hypothetical protein
MFGPRFSRISARLSVVAGAAVLAAVTLAGSASAVTLRGGWAPLNRCPVDDPAMLAATGTTSVASCVAADSPSGSITIGATTLPAGATNLQFGLVSAAGKFTVIPPAGGAIVSDPVQVPGGLLGLMCPSNIPIVSAICDQLANGAINGITATVLPAGAPYEFSLPAGLGVGQPILRLPVKIHLENPFLGPNCFIGTDANPIVLHPANLAAPTRGVTRFNLDGTPNPVGVAGYVTTAGNQGDSTFAVPGASGCGLFGILNGAVNQRQGLPSAAGSNSLVLNNSTTRFGGGFFTPANFAPNEGQQLSNAWHAAVVS